ncbi:MAG: hypothetical protein OXC82_11790 [Rhodobacteraceae bacterium]|nr:hypothetical protein [Paracoccaceae bacterium]MCY4251099.1 hypothetical protein [Paracoccaceae bacterium]MCY4309240.1 hypothetical protein [Paracoccaceae bacterium]
MIEEWAPYFALIGTAIVLGNGLISIGIWIGNVNSDRNSFKEFMREIREDIKKLGKRLAKLSDDITVIKTQKSVLKTGSLISLTEFGKKISEEIGAKDFAQKEAKEFFRLDAIQSKNVYDIQRFSLEYIHIDFEPNEEYLSKMKEVSYKNGIPLGETKDVLAIELRDALLQMIKEQNGDDSTSNP